MKKALIFAAIALGTTAVGLAISGPPRSAEKPAPTPRVSISADVAADLGGVTPNNAPRKYLPPSYGFESGSRQSRGASPSISFRPGVRSRCGGGGCCPK